MKVIIRTPLDSFKWEGESKGNYILCDNDNPVQHIYMYPGEIHVTVDQTPRVISVDRSGSIWIDACDAYMKEANHTVLYKS